MSQTSTTPDVGALFQEAHDQGDISVKSLQVLTNIGDHFKAALGVPVQDVVASEVTQFAVLLDDSISMVPNVGEVILGYNNNLNALLASKQASNILFHTRFYKSVLHPFVGLADAEQLDTHNYRPGLGNTPLYDGALDLLATVTAKAQDFASNGVPVRSVTLFVTDGANNSSKHTETDVQTIVRDLLRSESHIVAGMGIDDGWTNYRAVFGSMGIDDNWILTPTTDPSSLRQAWALVSQSALRASQSAGSFSQTALGGFAS